MVGWMQDRLKKERRRRRWRIIILSVTLTVYVSLSLFHPCLFYQTSLDSSSVTGVLVNPLDMNRLHPLLQWHLFRYHNHSLNLMWLRWVYDVNELLSLSFVPENQGLSFVLSLWLAMNSCNQSTTELEMDYSWETSKHNTSIANMFPFLVCVFVTQSLSLSFPWNYFLSRLW